MKITELFERSVPWEWRPTFLGRDMAFFEIDGIEYMAGFNEYEDLAETGIFPELSHGDVWLVGFAAKIDGQWRQDDVGGTSPKHISTLIATFLEIIKDFVRKQKPPVLAIPAAKKRERIYAAMAKRFEKEARNEGYEPGGMEEVTFPQFGRSVVFYFIRQE